MGLVGGGTWAYFSDVEVSQGNILTAGTLDLDINGTDANVQILNVTATYPGDSSNGSTSLVNAGSLPGDLSISFVKATDIGGAGGTEFEDAVGDLDTTATIALFLDLDEDSLWSDGDILLTSAGGGGTQTRTAGSPATPTMSTIDAYDGDSWADVTVLDASGGGDDGVNIFINYLVPPGAGNEIQGDSVSANMTFTLDQQ